MSGGLLDRPELAKCRDRLDKGDTWCGTAVTIPGATLRLTSESRCRRSTKCYAILGSQIKAGDGSDASHRIYTQCFDRSDVIGQELLDGVSGGFGIASVFTVHYDDGSCLSFYGWMVDAEVLRDLGGLGDVI